MNTKLSQKKLKTIATALNKLAPKLKERGNQIKFPLKTVSDAQGEMGITDQQGKAVIWLSEYHTPNRYVWDAEKNPTPRPNVKGEQTYYPKRNLLALTICEILNEIQS